MKKYTLKESIEYWDRRSNQWLKDIDGGKHLFANEIYDKIEELDFDTVLDYGCGIGQAKVDLFYLKNYTGVDISRKMINMAKKRLPKISFNTLDSGSLKLPGNYDLIFTHTVLEHIPNDFYKKLLPVLLKSAKICMFVEPDITKIKWGEYIHGFDRDYLKDLSKFNPVEKVEINDSTSDKNNAIFIVQGV